MKPLGLALAVCLSIGAVGTAYRTGPPPGHTGAFGEPDCGACHFDAGGVGSGSLTVKAPESYRPEEPVHITIELRHLDMAAAGFQLTARFTDGSNAGRQAGVLAPSDRVGVEVGEGGVLYAAHTAAGSALDESGLAVWTVAWTPPHGQGPVALDVAAQASNDDDSEFGEQLYLTRRIVEPEPG